MQSLTKEAEQKLIAAIERAAEFVNTGMSPNDAIVKSAAAANVPAGHINLMVHAYNTGRTTKQREQGEDTLEKAADFQLADAQTVMDALYPKAVKTSAEIVRQQVVSTDYAVSPAGMLARRRAEQEKTAAARVALPEKTYQPYPRDERFAVERAYSEKRAAQLAREEVRRQANAAYTKAAAAMDAVAEFFKRPGNMSFADATKQVELRLGDDGVSVLNKVAEVYPHFKKQAATNAHHFGDNPVYGLVQDVLSSVTEYVTASSKIEKEAEISKKKEPEFLTGSIMYDPAQEPLELAPPMKRAALNDWNPIERLRRLGNAEVPSPETVIGGAAGRLTALPQAVVGGRRGGFFHNMQTPTRAVGETLGEFGAKARSQTGMMADIMGLSKDPNKMRADAFKDLTAPDHELTLKNIQAQATLHDLMMNDDVISGYDPRDVAVAFNEIAGTAPNVVSAPAVLASVLRKRLEAGQLADFDAKQLIEMDKLKAERDHKMLEAQKLETESA